MRGMVKPPRPRAIGGNTHLAVALRKEDAHRSRLHATALFSADETALWFWKISSRRTDVSRCCATSGSRSRNSEPSRRRRTVEPLSMSTLLLLDAASRTSDVAAHTALVCPSGPSSTRKSRISTWRRATLRHECRALAPAAHVVHRNLMKQTEDRRAGPGDQGGRGAVPGARDGSHAGEVLIAYVRAAADRVRARVSVVSRGAASGTPVARAARLAASEPQHVVLLAVPGWRDRSGWHRPVSPPSLPGCMTNP